MTSPASARARFIAAVRKIEEACPYSADGECPECGWLVHKPAREVVEAFAEMEARWRADDITCTLASCKAALLREYGIEEPADPLADAKRTKE